MDQFQTDRAQDAYDQIILGAKYKCSQPHPRAFLLEVVDALLLHSDQVHSVDNIDSCAKFMDLHDIFMVLSEQVFPSPPDQKHYSIRKVWELFTPADWDKMCKAFLIARKYFKNKKPSSGKEGSVGDTTGSRGFGLHQRGQ